MLQRSPYIKVTLMNTLSRLKRTDLQASHRATWNIYLEQISQTDRGVFHGTASHCLFRDHIQALTTTVDINITLASLFLVCCLALMQDSVSALQGLVIMQKPYTWSASACFHSL